MLCGSSYDKKKMWQAPDIQEVATEVGQCLVKGDTSSAFRLIARFLEFYDKADWRNRERLVAPRPDSTGSERYDAMLAGIVDYACATQRVLAPIWGSSDLSGVLLVGGLADVKTKVLQN